MFTLLCPRLVRTSAFGWIFLCGALFVSAETNDSSEQASTDPRWLGTANLNLEKALANVARRREQTNARGLARTLKGYEDNGGHDPRWDADVHETIVQRAHWSAGDLTPESWT